MAIRKQTERMSRILLDGQTAAALRKLARAWNTDLETALNTLVQENLDEETPIRCRLHEGFADYNCATDCAIVRRFTVIEERVKAILAIANNTHEASQEWAEGLVSDEAALDTIGLLAKSILEDESSFGHQSADKRLNRPSLRFLEALGLIGEKSVARLRLVAVERTESKIRRAS